MSEAIDWDYQFDPPPREVVKRCVVVDADEYQALCAENERLKHDIAMKDAYIHRLLTRIGNALERMRGEYSQSEGNGDGL